MCKNHSAPFDFVYHAFMGTYKTILALANRSGGKTMNMAIIALLNSRGNDKCETANLGAIQAQALRCYRYQQSFASMSDDFKNFMMGDPTMSRTQWINQSVNEVLVATVTGVNSPHPQKLMMDEIELINWFVLQQALSMVQSKEEVRGTTVLGSTRKFAQGPMQRLVDSATGGNIKVFEWCIWEVVEAFPKDPAMQETIRKTFGSYLPANIQESDGYYKWDDLIDKFNNLDRDIWETEWECKRPQSQGLVYPRFDDLLNTDLDFKLDLQNNQLYLFEDFGYAKDHPDVILFAQVNMRQGTITIFDELYLTLMGTDDIISEVTKKLETYGLTTKALSGWIGDYHGLTEIRDRFNKGMPMMEKVTEDEIEGAAQLYQLVNGIPLVRKMIDERKIKVTSNIQGLRNEMKSYSKRRLPDGRFADDPEKINDHGPDALRYGVIRLFPSVEYRSFDSHYADNAPAVVTPNDIPVPMYTTGLMSKKL